MKKLATYCLQVLAVVGVVALSSCKRETPAPLAAPTIKAENGITYVNNKFEKGEFVKVKVTATIAGGAQAFQIWKKIGSGTNTNVTGTYEGMIAGPATTSYNTTFTFPVEETYNATTAAENVVVYTFKVRNASMAKDQFVETTYTYNVAAQGQGGTGGTMILLKPLATVTLSSSKSYLKTSNATAYTSLDVSIESSASQQAIDLTFGACGESGTMQTGTNATHYTFVSPDRRAAHFFDNALGGNVRRTTLGTTNITSLANITATDVHHIQHFSPGGPGGYYVSAASATPVFSFINADGKKGYIRVASVTGTDDARTVTVEVLVQN